MNPGGEPERDDTGLPPVDIEIPDDARELDRDVQAYYREQRAQRRRQRRIRLHGSLAKDGIVLPLLACCLILALITGTLLTIFTATSGQGLPGLPTKPKPTASARSTAPSRAPASTGPAAAAGPDVVLEAGPLPAIMVPEVAGGPPVALRSLAGAVLVLIPPACGCSAGLQWLTGVADDAGATIYLVATPATLNEVRQLDVKLAATIAPPVQVLLDKQETLPRHYPPHGLTAILVSPSKSVAYADHISSGGDAAKLTQALTG